MIQNSSFQGYKKAKLHELVRSRKVKYYYKMNKLELIVLVTNLDLSTVPK